MKRPLISIVLILALLIAGALVLSKIRLPSLFGGGPDPETVASASLQAVREQARLTPFAAPSSRW